jgi:acyl phosphate:glycerol-3-phosphate acyltransferase
MPFIVLSAYLVGSVPFALLLARRWGTADLRRLGSGNLGAANVLRSTGVAPGVLVAALDIGKGVASVILAAHLTGAPVAPAAAGLAAIVGHVYPVWLGFRGGKGVATACGVFAVLAPAAALAALAIFVTSVWLTRYVSVGSVLASMTLPVIAYSTGRSAPIVAVSAVAAGLIVFRHRSNLSRVFAGTERRLGRGRPADRFALERGREAPDSPDRSR